MTSEIQRPPMAFDYTDVAAMPITHRQVAQLLVQGFSAKEAAQAVGVQPPQVATMLDALLKAMEARGMRVTVETVFHKTYTFAYLDGVRVPFDLIEGQCKGEVYDEWQKKKKMTFVLSGQLVLRVCSEHWSWNKEWRDKEGKRRVEDCLNKFMVSLHEEAAKVNEWNRGQQRQRIEQEEKQRREEEARRRREAEAAKVQELENFVQGWRFATDIRDFLAAVEQKHEQHGGIAETSELAEWIRWGRSHADRIDPLVPTPSE